MIRKLSTILLLSLAWPGLADASNASPVTAAYNLPTDKVIERIAFGSCLSQGRPQPILKSVAIQNPDLFLMMGDGIYADYNEEGRIAEPSAEAIRDAYALQAAHPDFSAFAQSVPLLSMWDDHDYGWNDAGVEFPIKQESKDAFLDFYQVPEAAGLNRREGLYQSLSIGPEGKRVQFILLDLRWFRSSLKPTDQRGARGKERYLPDETPGKTLMGEAQWQWLASQLAAPADLKVLVSPIQVLADGHGWERWGNLPLERERLYSLLDQHSQTPLLILSGDRHFAGFYQRVLPSGLRLTEATSSSLNLSFFDSSDEQGPHQIGPLIAAENFGLLSIDWAKKKVLIELRGMEGVAAQALDLSF